LSAQGVDPGLAWRLRYVLDPPRARVYRSTNQAIATGTATPIACDTALYNAGGLWSAAQPTRLAAPVAGLYALVGAVQWDGSAAGTYRQTYLRLNGATVLKAVVAPPFAVGLQHLVADEYGLHAGDYVELIAVHDAGVAVNVVTNGTWAPGLLGRRVADLA
jgi:hypothetical protein